MFVKSNSAYRDNWLKLFSAIWAFALITPLIYFPGPSALFGHPWKVEFSISLILCSSLFYYVFLGRKNKYLVSISPKLISLIIAPFCVFVVWSALSGFWADSLPSVAHHTLVWSGYLIFFIFALYIVSNKKLFKISIISLGSVVSVIGLSCIFEFVFEERIGETFGFRYSRFAEMFAALLPLFFSFVLRLKRKHFVWAIFVTLFIWLGLIFSTSRGSLFSAIIGMSVFVLLRIVTKKNFFEKRRFVVALAGLFFVVFLTQIPLVSSSEQKASTFSRIATKTDKDPNNSFSRNVRFLFVGVGKEMVLDNYLTGVGADNFGLEFNKYRAVFSSNPQNKSTAEIQEEYLPERAHNEYLQILAELGIVGALVFFGLLAGIVKLGFAEITKNRFQSSNILTHAAVAGIAAFLVSSLFSSFSFRLMQNGLVFFFLLAILLRNYVNAKNRERSNSFVAAPNSKLVFTSIALVACLALTLFSAFKATSQFFVYSAEKETDSETARSYYENAILFDSANASAHYSFGTRLLGENNYAESAAQFRQAVDKGINTSVTYSYLISAQTLARQVEPALETSSEAIELFPYSVFLRVRHAALLKKFDRHEESEKQFQIAARLHEKQAATWRMLINNGALTTSQASRKNAEILSLEELKPGSAVYAVLAERQIVYPNEKPKFNF